MNELEYNKIIAEKLFGYTKTVWVNGVTNEKKITYASPTGETLAENELPNFYSDNLYLPSIIDKLLSLNVIVSFSSFGLNSILVSIPSKDENGKDIAESDENISSALVKSVVSFLQRSA